MSSLIFISLLLFTNGKQSQVGNTQISDTLKLYNTFDKSNHLQPDFDKSTFDALHGWDFGWAILEPINIAGSLDDEEELAKRLSPGQKALYFFWYLDAQVTNGGFIQFYWNDYRTYVPTIREGLKLVGDNELLQLLDKADQEYLIQKNKFDIQKAKDDWSPLYSDLVKFEQYDETYYEIHDRTMELIEKYARLHPDEFVNFTD